MVSSLAGKNPIAGLGAYCASKAALDQLAACLMLEVRHQGVKVTTIAPGSVDTAFGGAPRAADTSWMLTAEDVAQTVVDLLRMRDGAHSSRWRCDRPGPRSASPARAHPLNHRTTGSCCDGVLDRSAGEDKAKILLSKSEKQAKLWTCPDRTVS